MTKFINGTEYDMNEKEYNLILTSLYVGKSHLLNGHFKRAKVVFERINVMIEMLEMQERFSDDQIAKLYAFVEKERKMAREKRITMKEKEG